MFAGKIEMYDCKNFKQFETGNNKKLNYLRTIFDLRNFVFVALVLLWNATLFVGIATRKFSIGSWTLNLGVTQIGQGLDILVVIVTTVSHHLCYDGYSWHTFTQWNSYWACYVKPKLPKWDFLN